ncbi:MAG: mismatch repair protein MutT [Alphaproteobacteria bacterium]|nr:mismatch repair protein MutT [Alphaproteobacteria bacterium]
MIKTPIQKAGIKVYVLLEREDRFFAMRRINTGFMDGFYTPPAGRVDEGETFIDAAIRETKEEAGITVNPEALDLVHIVHREGTERYKGTFWIDVFFKCLKWEGEPFIAEPNKSDELRWINYNEAGYDFGKSFDAYFKQVFLNIQKGIKFSIFGWNDEQRVVNLKEAG